MKTFLIERLSLAIRQRQLWKVNLLSLMFPFLLHEWSADGLTPLHLAVRVGSKRMISILLKRGASLDQVDRDGNSPYQHAVDLYSKRIVEYLRDMELKRHGSIPQGMEMPEFMTGMGTGTSASYDLSCGDDNIVNRTIVDIDPRMETKSQ